MSERESGYVPEDLHNEDVVTRIFESGSPEDVERVREAHNLTEEKVQLYSQFAKQRKQTLEQMRSAYKLRDVQQEPFTPDELSLGFPIEKIEPQVRAAVINLRRKGYATSISGYDNYDSQSIGFREEQLENFRLPEEFLYTLQQEGITVIVKPNEIAFRCDRYLEVDELQNIWNRIEQRLPDLGKIAEPNMYPKAQNFRKRNQ